MVGKKQVHKQVSMREHIKNKSMWAGSKENQESKMVVLNDAGYLESTTIEYPPALYKIIDEIIVNAIDHYVNNNSLVKKIDICLEPDGSISVRNDGPGITIQLTENLNGDKMYTPQLIFSEYLSGSNLDADEDADRVVGGQNGLGSKITSVNSDYFTVETIDKISNKHYIQTYRDGLLKIEEPIIKKAAKSTKSFTKITFLPSYKVDFNVDIEKFFETLKKLIEVRAYQAAAYTGIKTTFNGNVIPIKGFEDYCKKFNVDIYKSVMTQPNGKHPWEVCIGISDGKERHASIINGICVNDGGNHIKFIQKLMVEHIQPFVIKECKLKKADFKKRILLNNLFIFMKGAIPNPTFKSQTKEMISNPMKTFSDYSFPRGYWKKLWEFISADIMQLFLQQQLGTVKKTANRSKLDIPKYTEATLVRNSKRWHETGLIITEGDSATGIAEAGLKSKASPTFNYEYFGTFGIQGVPMNSLKESSEITSNKTKNNVVKKGKSKKQDTSLNNKFRKVIIEWIMEGSPNTRMPSPKLLKNERLSSLVKILGLDFNKTYDFTEKGNKEMETLRYGFIVGLMDQDLDGFNIFGLVVTFILTFWPYLGARNYIRRILTPLIRAYPKNKKKNKVMEFYSEEHRDKWIEQVGSDYVTKNYVFNFYKGLGSHDKAKGEVKQMFRNIKDKICIYEYDEDTLKCMNIYYGNSPELRKDNLVSSTMPEPVKGLRIPISQQFRIDTKLFQRNNILRKIVNSIDGFIEGRRKIFYAMNAYGRKRIKVQGAAGLAVKHANYHHGESSAEGSIIYMAQAFPQARNLPLLLPNGSFGNRSKGYKDNASSRYIFTMLNSKLTDKLFRKEDDYVLNYDFEDGERFQPKHYAPIIPYSLCESNSIPATGWTISVYARNIDSVIKNVKRMINGEIDSCKKLEINTDHINGRFVTHKKKNYFVGAYEYDEKNRIITIKGLPFDKWSYYYLEGNNADNLNRDKDKKDGIKHLEYIKDYTDYTTDDEVKIEIKLRPGAYEEISANYGNEVFDCIEDCFKLKSSINDRINLLDENNTLVEYTTYEEVFNYWYEYRKKLYVVRIEREKIINGLKIMMLKEIQRFCKLHDTYKITKKTTEEQSIEILSNNKYKIFNKSLIINPKFEQVDLLYDMVVSESYGANYDYLLNLSYKEINKEAYKRRELEINKLKERQEYLLDDTGKFPGSKIWLQELKELEEVIKFGKESKWQYNDGGYTFDDDSSVQ